MVIQYGGGLKAKCGICCSHTNACVLMSIDIWQFMMWIMLRSPFMAVKLKNNWFCLKFLMKFMNLNVETSENIIEIFLCEN